jgi:general stress protein CsbA
VLVALASKFIVFFLFCFVGILCTCAFSLLSSIFPQLRVFDFSAITFSNMLLIACLLLLIRNINLEESLDSVTIVSSGAISVLVNCWVLLTTKLLC